MRVRSVRGVIVIPRTVGFMLGAAVVLIPLAVFIKKHQVRK